MMTKIVRAAQAVGLNMSLLQLFGKGPKWQIQCGDCGYVFEERLPMGVNNPRLPCPHCNVLNEILLEWE